MRLTSSRPAEHPGAVTQKKHDFIWYATSNLRRRLILHAESGRFPIAAHVSWLATPCVLGVPHRADTAY